MVAAAEAAAESAAVGAVAAEVAAAGVAASSKDSQGGDSSAMPDTCVVRPIRKPPPYLGSFGTRDLPQNWPKSGSFPKPVFGPK